MLDVLNFTFTTAAVIGAAVSVIGLLMLLRKAISDSSSSQGQTSSEKETK